MNRLGIYFGPQAVSIVETKGKLPINNIQIPHSAVLGGELSEEKVPEEIKIATLLKDELIKNKIEAKEATVILPGKDLIIRTFEMPPLPQRELRDAVNFEVKKYIPFKVEDLVSDFQWRQDKFSRKIYVLFVGIKKETLNKYLSVFTQLGLKIASIEYSAFALLRLFKLVHIREKGIIAVTNIDLMENDEANFVILDNGLPLFSRDITFIGGPQKEAISDKEAGPGQILEKLKRELVISLHYYDRKFLGKKTSKIFFIMHPVSGQDPEIFKDMGLGIQFIDVNKYIGETSPLSLTSIKAYSGSLLGINTGIKINLLLAAKLPTREISVEKPREFILISRLKSQYKVAVITGLLIFIIVLFFGIFQILPLKKELKEIMGMRPKVSIVRPGASYEELTDLDSEYKVKIDTLDNLIKQRLYLTELLEAIGGLVPEGMWLRNLSFERTEGAKLELTLDGQVYLGDSNKEFELVNTFLSDLKKAPFFDKYLKEINLLSLDRRGIEGQTRTSFVISCSNYKKRQ